MEPLAGWENFYVITGSSAGGLTGLTFVVIALAAEVRRVDPSGLNTFLTPTIVHFSAVLALSAFLCMPQLSLASVGIGLAAVSIAAVIYVARIGFSISRGRYVAVKEDWIWNVILPAVAYASLGAMALLVQRQPEAAECGIGAASVLLLFVGIHNAWDIAVWMTFRKRDQPE